LAYNGGLAAGSLEVAREGLMLMNASGLPGSESVSLSTLQRLRLGDARAWTRLTTIFSPLVFHWVLKSQVNRQDAPDIVQEVFSVVAQRVAEFRRDQPGATFRGWLFSITRNKVLAYRRRSRTTAQPTGGSDARHFFEQLSEPAEPDFDADEGIESLCQRAIAFVREEFSERAWQAFSRVVIDDQPPDAVARELEISVNSVYLAKSRILRRLRQEIGSLE
jgi:RNA polymerase sigma-70 factor (ECF subfamily)